MNSSELYAHTLSILGTAEVSVGNIVDYYMRTNVPDMTTARIYLGIPKKVREENPELNMDAEALNDLLIAGTAICDFINQELADEHPMDKRFLIRNMENLCWRFGLTTHQCPGFGHDVIFSKNPLVNYKNFDNSLYVPPLTGHWAIVQRGSKR